MNHRMVVIKELFTDMKYGFADIRSIGLYSIHVHDTGGMSNFGLIHVMQKSPMQI